MTPFQAWLFLLGGIVLAFPAAILISVAAGCLFMNCFRGRCPSCGKRKLDMVRFLKINRTDDGPRSIGYYQCLSCGARHKQGNGPDYEPVSEQEWKQFCERASLRNSST